MSLDVPVRQTQIFTVVAFQCVFLKLFLMLPTGVTKYALEM